MNEGEQFIPEEARSFDAEGQQREFLREVEVTETIASAKQCRDETDQSHQGEGVVEVKKSPEGRPDIDVTFLYILHSMEAGPEYVDKVLDKVANADLVLIEGVGQTKRMRQLNSLVLKALSVAAEKAPDNFIVRKLSELLRQSDSFRLQIMGEVVGSGNEVDFIDVAEGEPGYAEIVAARETNERISTLVEEGETEKALQLYPEFIDLCVESSKLREEIVVEQLKERFESIKEKKQVVVIQGAVHTSVYHTIKGMSLVDSLENVYLISSYPPGAVLIRKRRFLEKELSPDEYHRAFVGDYLFIPAGEKIWLGTPLTEIYSLSTKLSSKLSHSEIDQLLGDFSSGQKELVASLKEKFSPEVIDRFGIPGTVAAELTLKLAEKHGVKPKTRVGGVRKEAP